jgi:hypothetical protein
MTTISTSVNFTQKNINEFLWPITITSNCENKPINIVFETDIILTSSTNYFIIKTTDVYFNGKNKKISLSCIQDYPGLIQNGSVDAGDIVSDGYSNTILKNIKLFSNNSTQSNELFNGWMCQAGFGNSAINNFITNCHVVANVYSGGGICGGYTSYNNGVLYITNSSVKGNLIGSAVGGIIGINSPQANGKIYMQNTKFIGDVNGNESSGLIGPYSCGASLNEFYSIPSFLTLDNCEFIGNLNGNSSSGFVGMMSASLTGSNILICNCRFIGNINNYNCGGFVGMSSGTFGGIINIIKCSSDGQINPSPDINQGGSGGFLAPFCCFEGTINVIKSTYCGSLNQSFCGGIAGSSQISPAGEYISLPLYGNLTLTSCIVKANILSNYTGGVIGANIGFLTNGVNNGLLQISNSFYKGIIIGEYSAGLIAGLSTYPEDIFTWSFNDLKISNTEVNADVKNIYSSPIMGYGLPPNFYQYSNSINKIKIILN